MILTARKTTCLLFWAWVTLNGCFPPPVAAEHLRLVTLAGGGLDEGRKATDLSFEPGGIVVDRRGDVLVSDVSHNRVIRVDARSGISRTLVGNGVPGCATGVGAAAMASLNRPRGLLLNAEGDLYIANAGCRAFSRVDLGSGTVTRAAAMDAYDATDFAVDRQNRLIVVDTQRHRIHRIDPADGSITVIAGNGSRQPDGTGTFSGDGSDATLAGLNNPHDVTLDEEGNVYVADSGNHRVRRVDRAGVIQSFSVDEAAATIAFGSYGSPSYVSLDRRGNILASADSRVWRIERRSGKIHLVVDLESPGETRGLRAAGKVAVSPEGALYVLDWRSRIVLRVNSESGSSDRFAGGGPRSSGDGGPARDARLEDPGAIAVDSRREILYFAERTRVRKISLKDRMVLPVAGENAARAGDPLEPRSLGDGLDASRAVIGSPSGLAVDPDGNLYVADSLHNRIRKIERSSNLTTTFAGNGSSESSSDNGPAREAGLAGPGSMAFDTSGNLYVADRSRIRRISTSGVISTVAGMPETFEGGDGGPATHAAVRPGRLAVDSTGNIYFTDCTPYGDVRAIRMIDARSRVINTILGDDSLRYQIFRTAGLVVDGSGRLYLSDGDSQIRKYDPETRQLTPVLTKYDTTVLGPDEPPLDAPAALAIDSHRNIFFSEYRSQRIRILRSDVSE